MAESIKWVNSMFPYNNLPLADQSQECQELAWSHVTHNGDTDFDA